MRNNLLLASLAVVISGGCVGGLSAPTGTGPGSDPTGTSTARALFNSTVVPLLSECSSCHVGAENTTTNMFLGASQTSDSYYDGITGDEAINGDFTPSAASILTHGAHQGSAWTAPQAAIISTWLVAESAARGGGGGGGGGSGTGSSAPVGNPTASALGAEMQWASCMSISATEYNTTVAYAIADMNSDNGRCYSCHEPGGAGGAYWGVNNKYMDMLAKWQTQVFITGAFEPQEQGTTTITYKMAVAEEKICSKGTEQQNNQGTHPTFDCNQTVDGVKALDALTSFAAMVQAKADAGTCPTPAFAPVDAGDGSGSGSGTN